RPPCSPLFPYTTLFRSFNDGDALALAVKPRREVVQFGELRRGERRVLGLRYRRVGLLLVLEARLGLRAVVEAEHALDNVGQVGGDRKSTRLNSSHVSIS